MTPQMKTISMVLATILLVGSASALVGVDAAVDTSVSTETNVDTGTSVDSGIVSGDTTAEADVRVEADAGVRTRSNTTNEPNDTGANAGSDGSADIGVGIVSTVRNKVADVTADARVRIREQVEHSSQASYRQARERYETASEEYSRARAQLSAGTGPGIETSIALDVRKRVALSAAERLESYLEMLEAHVSTSEAFNETERTDVLVELDAYGEWLANVSTEIEAAESPDELAGVIGEMRSEWAQVQAYARIASGESVLAKTKSVHAQAVQASERIEANIEAAARAGVDVTAAREHKAAFDARLQASAEHAAQAERGFEAAESAGAQAYAQARVESSRARAELKAAYDELRATVAELRSANVEARAEARAEAEAS